MLNSKIVEEANELCAATSTEDISWEAADLLYFSFVKCVAAGVTLTDIERNLNFKSKKITRRKGDAKPSTAFTPKICADSELLPYQMRVIQLDKITNKQQDSLLLRPIIKTNEIMDRVRPICEKVRNEGDKALLEFTKKFDKVEMESNVIKAPFEESMMKLDPKVKKAIDQAYDNIFKFHAAQMEDKPLVVETMPGVICTRFVRPIEKVGLYIPGGTAILPSTALMLGIPAKVAGCDLIIIATPPRPDGTVTPEVKCFNGR